MQYYFLFIFWDIFEFAFIYFLYVETRRRTLEELSGIFNAKNPVKESLSRTKIVVHGNRGVTEMLDKDSAEEPLYNRYEMVGFGNTNR
jgi:hypothetical protein